MILSLVYHLPFCLDVERTSIIISHLALFYPHVAQYLTHNRCSIHGGGVKEKKIMKKCTQVISNRQKLKLKISESKFFTQQTFVKCPYYLLWLLLNPVHRQLKKARFMPWKTNMHTLSRLKKVSYYKTLRHILRTLSSWLCAIAQSSLNKEVSLCLSVKVPELYSCWKYPELFATLAKPLHRQRYTKGNCRFHRIHNQQSLFSSSDCMELDSAGKSSEMITDLNFLSAVQIIII